MELGRGKRRTTSSRVQWCLARSCLPPPNRSPTTSCLNPENAPEEPHLRLHRSRRSAGWTFTAQHWTPCGPGWELTVDRGARWWWAPPGTDSGLPARLARPHVLSPDRKHPPRGRRTDGQLGPLGQTAHDHLQPLRGGSPRPVDLAGITRRSGRLFTGAAADLPLDLKPSKVRGARAEIVLQVHGELIGTERAPV